MKQADFLRLMGIDRWYERPPSAPANPTHSNGSEQDRAWQTLAAEVAQCTACPLWRTRNRTVLGTGNRQAKLMLIGEAPGAQEDQQGEPFVGRAGKLLDKILAAVQLQRRDVYITNILKSRPPGNRDPQADEIAACTPFLHRQLELIQPTLLVALGRICAQYLLQTKTSLGRLRLQEWHYGTQQIPLIVTYHPAYLLRNPGEKRKAWQDWQTIKQRLTHEP